MQRPYVCKFDGCDKRFRYPYQQEEHQEVCQKGGGYGTLNCEYCLKRFSTRVHLQRHVRSIHMNLGTVKCDVCSMIFKRKDSLKKHYDNKHAKVVKIETDAGIFETNQEMLKREQVNLNDKHLQKMIHTETMYKCDLCGRKFSQKSSLRHHKQSKHGNIIIVCEICKCSFTTTCSLKEHLEAVHDISKTSEDKSANNNLLHAKVIYKCDLCDKTYTRNKSLISHKQSKHRDVNIVCGICQQKFTKSCSLKRHMKLVHDTYKVREEKPTNNKSGRLQYAALESNLGVIGTIKEEALDIEERTENSGVDETNFLNVEEHQSVKEEVTTEESDPLEMTDDKSLINIIF